MMGLADVVAVRVQVTQKGTTRYVSVVQDYQDAAGAWRVKTLQSFGPETPESIARAYQYKANCEAVREFAQRSPQDRDEVFSAALVVFGLILGAAVIAALLDSE